MGKLGGVSLVQDTKPIKLIGSLVSEIDDDGRGWVHFGFFQEPGAFALVRGDGCVSGKMSSTISVVFISELYVQLAAIQWLRGTHPSPGATELAPVERGLVIQVVRHEILFSWKDGIPEVALADVDGQVELRMSEDFARTLVTGLVNELGRVASWVSS